MTTVAHTNHAAPTRSKFLHFSLWSVQVLLGLAFLMAGSMKAATPYVELAENIAWMSAVPEGVMRIIGISEFLGVSDSSFRLRPASSRDSPCSQGLRSRW